MVRQIHIDIKVRLLENICPSFSGYEEKVSFISFQFMIICKADFQQVRSEIFPCCLGAVSSSEDGTGKAKVSN